ncbi:MAG: AraC family transcriptional regulator [Eubacteriales bacterium]|nr:AraC family transcriptional regulator [Eubacteriales bacterium]
MKYYDFVERYTGVTECKSNVKYSRAGHSFCLELEDRAGVYWVYESENFIIDIHDFFIKKEIIQNDVSDMPKFVSIYSSYMISVSGESFNPYQTLIPNTLYTINFDKAKNSYRVLLHENSHYLAVAIGFKKGILEEYLSSINIDYEEFFYEVFANSKNILTKALEPIAMDILNCKMEMPAAEMFFESKAREWMSIVIDAYLNRRRVVISHDDDAALENVAKYIEDHYAFDINQKTLEKISMMSGTKLKKLFKEKYQLSITEFTQRKRMNMAEVLLLNSQLSIKEIAKSVGYASHSKFSGYFKKYKGAYPKDIRNISIHGKAILECKDCIVRVKGKELVKSHNERVIK